MNSIIFAGGTGTRLWPASRKSKPKQFLKLVGNRTLLQQTFARMRKGFPTSNLFIATSKDYRSVIQQQLPQLPKSNFSLEPTRQDRGPALGLALLIMNHQNNDDIFTTAWSDDFIKQDNIYHDTLKKTAEFVKDNPNSLVAIGITPTAPNTSFRYLRIGNTSQSGVYKVKKFTDKPSPKTALKYFEQGNYLINSGYFVSSGKYIFELYKKHQPQCYRILMQIKHSIGTRNQQKTIDRLYPKIKPFDFEEILMNHPNDLYVSPGAFDWADVGRWGIIKDIQSGPSENLIKGNVVTHKTTGSLIYNYNDHQLVTVLDKNNLVVVVTDQAILITDKNKTDELKELIKHLERNKKYSGYL